MIGGNINAKQLLERAPTSDIKRSNLGIAAANATEINQIYNKCYENLTKDDLQVAATSAPLNTNSIIRVLLVSSLSRKR